MNRDYWFLLASACIVVGSLGLGIHLGYQGAVNSNDLVLANGIEIVDYKYTDGPNLTYVKFPGNVTVFKENYWLIAFIGKDNGRNLTISSEQGVFLAPGITSIVIPDKENATRLNASTYGEKMIVVPYSAWERYKKAKTAMDQTVRLLIYRAGAQWDSDNQARLNLVGVRFNKTGNQTNAEKEMLVLMREETGHLQAVKAMEERRYISNANNSVLDALLFPGGL